MVKKFQKVVDNYFEKDLHLQDELPTVNYLADKRSVSTRYLSDVLKQETGKTALEHIHIYLIK